MGFVAVGVVIALYAFWAASKRRRASGPGAMESEVAARDRRRIARERSLALLTEGPADRRLARLSGGLLLCGAAIASVGTALPWVVLSDPSLGISANRTAYETGVGSRFEPSSGLLLLIGCIAVVLALGSMRMLGVRPPQWIPRIWPAVTAASIFAVFESWPGSWQVHAGVSVGRGYGGWVSLAGLGCVVTALLVEGRTLQREFRFAGQASDAATAERAVGGRCPSCQQGWERDLVDRCPHCGSRLATR